MEDLSEIVVDGMGVKKKGGAKGELRVVVGITQAERVEPLGCFDNTVWPDLDCTVRNRLREANLTGFHPFMTEGRGSCGCGNGLALTFAFLNLIFP